MFVAAFVKEYLADKSASMATQVVMFSVLLFGTSGVVLDFGRVYSEHSIMQSYTDQAALAAAAELDRAPDAIDRAVDAVFGGVDAEGNDLGAPLPKSAVFSSGEDNQFNISHLVFLSDLGDDSGAQSAMAGVKDDIVYVAFSDGASNGDAAAASLDAKYVIAVAQERSVSNTLIKLINSGAETAAASSNVVRTVAAARRQVTYCGEFSNLVMCSPRTAMEAAHPDPDGTPDLGDFMEYFEGARFAHFADNDAGTEIQRIYRRRNPAIGAEDTGGMQSLSPVETICNTLATLPGAAEGANNGKLAEYQAICHLAAAQPRNHCIGEKLEIVAAEPEVITTALNVAFDMWDAPIDEVVNVWPSTAPADIPLFQPDLLIYKGKIYQDDATVRSATNTTFSLGTNHASRLHYYEFTAVNPSSGEPYSSTIPFNLNLPECFRSLDTISQCGNVGESLPGIAPFIGNPANSTALNAYYQAAYPQHYQYLGGSLSGSAFSFFDVYLQERSGWSHAASAIAVVEFNYATFSLDTVTVVEEGQPFTIERDEALNPTLGFAFEDASLADTTPAPDYTQQDIATNHRNYPASIFVDPDDPTTRRRMSIPMVDCSPGSMVDANNDGIYEVDVLEFVDMYLLQPPTPLCSGEIVTDRCNNADIDEATVFSEFVEKSLYVENAVPELVR